MQEVEKQYDVELSISGLKKKTNVILNLISTASFHIAFFVVGKMFPRLYAKLMKKGGSL